LLDEVANATGEGVKDTTTSLIKTISNAFQPGEAGAEAHRELWDLAAKATFVIAVIFIAYIVASYIGRVGSPQWWFYRQQPVQTYQPLPPS